MHIVFVIAVYPPESEPSAVMGEELVRGLREAGHRVDVVCPFPNRPGGEIYPGYRLNLRQVEQQPGGRLSRVGTWLVGPKRKNRDRVLENVSFGMSSALELIRGERPDVMLLETWPILSYLPLVAVARSRGVPMVNYIKDIYPEAAVSAGVIGEKSLVSRVLHQLDTFVCHACSRNVVISERMRDEISQTRSLPDERVVVIKDWLDLEQIHPFEGKNTWRRRVGLPEDRFLCMFAGTLGHASGANILVDVAEELRGERVHLCCVGEGVLKEGMKQDAETRGLDNITLLPFQPREEVAEMQSSADVMLLITASGMGLSSVPSKFVTYMAVGRPTICAVQEQSDIGALVKKERLGFVVSPGSAEDLAGAILKASRMPEQELAAMGTRAKRTAEKQHSLSGAIEKFQRVFRDVVNDTQNVGG